MFFSPLIGCMIGICLFYFQKKAEARFARKNGGVGARACCSPFLWPCCFARLWLTLLLIAAEAKLFWGWCAPGHLYDTRKQAMF